MAFNLKAREDFKKNKRARMGVWEAIELLNTLVDESDPDVRFFNISSVPVFFVECLFSHYLDEPVADRPPPADCRSDQAGRQT